MLTNRETETGIRIRTTFGAPTHWRLCISAEQDYLAPVRNDVYMLRDNAIAERERLIAAGAHPLAVYVQGCDCFACAEGLPHPESCPCPECDPDSYRVDEPLTSPDPDDPNYGSLISGCWCPEGHCTCDAVAMHRAEFE